MTNILSRGDKYISQLGQIHYHMITFILNLSNLSGYMFVTTNILSRLDKLISQFGQIHYHMIFFILNLSNLSGLWYNDKYSCHFGQIHFTIGTNAQLLSCDILHFQSFQFAGYMMINIVGNLYKYISQLGQIYDILHSQSFQSVRTRQQLLAPTFLPIN